MKFLQTMRIDEEALVNDEVQPTEKLLNLKMLPTSKALKLYTTLSSTSTTNCFAPRFKRKLDKCMMNCDDHLRRATKCQQIDIECQT